MCSIFPFRLTVTQETKKKKKFKIDAVHLLSQFEETKNEKIFKILFK